MEQTSNFLQTIQQNLSLIAAQAGVVIERLWIILTKQQFLYGLQTFTKGVALLIAGIFIGKWMDGIKKSAMQIWDKQAVLVVFGLATVCLLFYGANMVVDSFPRLFNPEYYSVKEAVDMLQKVRR